MANRVRDAVLVVAGWGGLWYGTTVWGEELRHHYQLNVGAVPLMGGWDHRINGALYVSIAFGLFAIAVLPTAAMRLRFRYAVVCTMAFGAEFAYVINRNDGRRGLLRGVEESDSYFAALQRQPDLGHFVRNYVAIVHTGRIAVHVRGHPPGMVIVLAAMRALGLGTTKWFALLIVIGGAIAMGAAAVTLHTLAGVDIARRALPFLALSPAAIWIVSSPDAFFAAIVGLALMAIAFAVTRGGQGLAAWRWAIAAGLALGASMMLSYGLTLVAIPIAVIVLAYRKYSLLVPVAVAAAMVVIGFVPFGFWWLDGLRETRHQYLIGISSHRPWWYFIIANVAAFSVSIGPMTWLAIAWMRKRGHVLFVVAVLGAVAAADISGMSKAEVERIWLPFAIPLLAAGAALWVGRRPLMWVRGALVAQVGVAIAVQTLINSQW